MPLVPLIVGVAALFGVGTVANVIDDNIIDPLTGQTDRPILSDRVVAVAGVVAAAYLAKRAGVF